MKFLLANGDTVDATIEEMQEFITGSVAVSNPHWRYSQELTKDEVMRFLKRESTRAELERIAKYILLYAENLTFTGHLFDKSLGTGGQSKEFNMPVLMQLREISQGKIDWETVWQMENMCMSIGIGPL